MSWVEIDAVEMPNSAYLDVKFEAISEAQIATVNSIKAVEDQMKSLNKNLSNLIKSVDSMQKQFSSAENNRTLEWAIQNAGCVDFNYHIAGGTVQKKSCELIQNILVRLRRGRGTYLPEQAFSRNRQGRWTADCKKEFEARVVSAIRDLLGKKPVITDKEGKRYIHMDSSCTNNEDKTKDETTNETAVEPRHE